MQEESKSPKGKTSLIGNWMFFAFVLATLTISAVTIGAWVNKFSSSASFLNSIPSHQIVNFDQTWNVSKITCRKNMQIDCVVDTRVQFPIKLPTESIEDQKKMIARADCHPETGCKHGLRLSMQLTETQKKHILSIRNPHLVLGSGNWFTFESNLGTPVRIQTTGESIAYGIDKRKLAEESAIHIDLYDLKWSIIGPEFDSPFISNEVNAFGYIARQYGHLLPSFISDITLLFFFLICLFGAVFVPSSSSIVSGVFFLGFTTLHYSVANIIYLGMFQSLPLETFYEWCGFIAAVILPICFTRLIRTTIDNGFIKKKLLSISEKFALPFGITSTIQKTPQWLFCLAISLAINLIFSYTILFNTDSNILLRLHYHEVSGFLLCAFCLGLSFFRRKTLYAGEDSNDPKFKASFKLILMLSSVMLFCLGAALLIENSELNRLGISTFDSFPRSSFVPGFALTQIFDLILLFRSHSFLVMLSQRLNRSELNFTDLILSFGRFTDACIFMLQTIDQCCESTYEIKKVEAIIAIRTNPNPDMKDFLYERFLNTNHHFECESSERIQNPFDKMPEAKDYLQILDHDKQTDTRMVFAENDVIYLVSTHQELNFKPVFIVKIQGRLISYFHQKMISTLESIASGFSHFTMYLSDQKASESFVSSEIIKTFSVFRLSGLRPGMSKNLKRFVSFVDIARYTKLSELVGGQEMAKITSEFDIRMTRVIEEFDHKGSFLLRYVGDGNIAVHDDGDAVIESMKRMVEETRKFELEMREYKEFMNVLEDSRNQIALNLSKNKPENQIITPNQIFNLNKPIISIRFGVNYGPLSVIIAGIDRRRDVEIKGDMVNKAARLEKASKTYKTTALLGGDCIPYVDKSLIESGELRLIGMNLPRGSNIPIEYWELTSIVDDPEQRNLRMQNAKELTTIVLELSQPELISIDNIRKRLLNLNQLDYHVQMWTEVLGAIQERFGDYIEGPIYLAPQGKDRRESGFSESA